MEHAVRESMSATSLTIAELAATAGTSAHTLRY